MEKMPQQRPEKKAESTSEKKPTRRTFLKGFAAAMTGAIAGPKAFDKLDEFVNRETLVAEIQEAKHRLHEEFGIHVRTSPGDAASRESLRRSFEPMSLVDQHRSLQRCEEQLQKYPKILLRLLRDLNIVLAKALDGRAGEADRDMITITPNWSGVDIIDRAAFNRVFQHELTHVLDGRTDGGPDQQGMDLSGNDVWPRGHYQEQPTNFAFLPEDGFVCRYGATNEDEDRAMIAQFLMNYPDINALALLASDDTVLREKIQAVKTRYFRWSFGVMDDRFWEDMSQGRVDENYWNRRRADRPTRPFLDYVKRYHPEATIDALERAARESG